MTGVYASVGALRRIVLRSLQHHALSTAVTVAAVALACGLTMSVFSLADQTRQAFTGGRLGFDAVLGARGSQLQLVLNAVYHLETSPGNVPWKVYRSVAEHPAVELAVPYALGDNYRGYRLVGTTQELFTKFEIRSGEKLRFAAGEPFDAGRMEVVLGATVAAKTGLRVGDTINPYHGLTYDPETRHEEEYVVIGVLAPTNTPMDRVAWIPIEGIFRMGGHVLRGSGQAYAAEGGKEIPDEHKEVSAVMLKLADTQSGFALEQLVNRQGTVATLAWPIGKVMAELFDRLGWVVQILALTAWLVMAVAAAAILASLHNTMNERRREFAILRALGARRRFVFAAITAESTLIAAYGVAAGFVVYLGIMALAAGAVRDRTGVVLDLFWPSPALAFVPPAMLLMGALAGIIPALKAYRSDVAEGLAPTT